ncbi:phage head closure protein [Clostridium botulinum C]|uniref:phage head closure protein n=1 Tax=Clostridium botulinum TaxID=1491 RepID=UPI001E5B0C77|nr:phage head closure protein [Clostridium botulinum]MCD3217880.1 phage head closure protein [Clostridium botulinum C]
MNITIGELNKRIEIGINESVQDDEGFETTTFKGFKAWAKVQNMSGTETFKNKSDYSKKTTRFIIRYRKDKQITTKHTILFNNKYYNIVYVNDYNESNEFIELVGELIE